MALRLLAREKIPFVLGVLAGFSVSLLMSSFTLLAGSGQRVPLADDVSGSAQTWRLPDFRAASAAARGDSSAGIRGDSAAGEKVREVKFDDLHAHHDDDSKAKEMARQVRVLVWVMTSPQNLDKKAVHVRNTWGKRANSLLFMSSEWNSTFPTIGLNVSEGRAHLTAKTMKAFRYIYQHHFDDADWFMKADDDTYVIMENLRYMLSSYSPQDPIYFGRTFKVFVKQGYPSGGAGYVLSKEAVRRLASMRAHNTSVCREDRGAEDVEVGQCLMNLGVKLLPSLDSLGRTRFHCFSPQHHLKGVGYEWFIQYDAYGGKGGLGNISDYAISFHYIYPDQMYELEYYTYHLRPFGIVSSFYSLNPDHRERTDGHT